MFIEQNKWKYLWKCYKASRSFKIKLFLTAPCIFHYLLLHVELLKGILMVLAPTGAHGVMMLWESLKSEFKEDFERDIKRVWMGT